MWGLPKTPTTEYERLFFSLPTLRTSSIHPCNWLFYMAAAWIIPLHLLPLTWLSRVPVKPVDPRNPAKIVKTHFFTGSLFEGRETVRMAVPIGPPANMVRTHSETASRLNWLAHLPESACSARRHVFGPLLFPNYRVFWLLVRFFTRNTFISKRHQNSSSSSTTEVLVTLP